MLTRRNLLASTPAVALAAATPAAAQAACATPIDPRERIGDLVDELTGALDTTFGDKVQTWCFRLNHAEPIKYRGFAFLFDHEDHFQFSEEVFAAVFPLKYLTEKAQWHLDRMQAASRRNVSDKEGERLSRQFFNAYDRVLGYVPRNFEETREKFAFILYAYRRCGPGFFDGVDAELLIRSFDGLPGTIVRPRRRGKAVVS